MPYEVKEMKGSLFPNEEKDHESQPDFTGNVKIGGKIYRLAAWNTTSQGGRDYMSISVTDPDEYRRRQEQHSGSRAMSDERFQAERARRQAAMKDKPSRYIAGMPPKPDIDIDDDDIPF